MLRGGVWVEEDLVERGEKNMMWEEGKKGVVGYEKGGVEFWGWVCGKWGGVDGFGGWVVVGEDMLGREWGGVMGGLLMEGVVWKKGNMVGKGWMWGK